MWLSRGADSTTKAAAQLEQTELVLLPSAFTAPQGFHTVPLLLHQQILLSLTGKVHVLPN